MTPDALWECIQVAGITLSADGDNIRATPRAAMTDALRNGIRANRATVLARLNLTTATSAERKEIRRHLIRLMPGEDHPDFPEAFALATANPEVHLMGLRASCPP